MESQPPNPRRTVSGNTKRRSKMSEVTENFGTAIAALKEGKKVARNGWNGKGMWLEMQSPDEHSKMTLPYIYLNYPDNAMNTPSARVPWLASQTDMLAEDWVILN
jgi:hypothetical protein